MAKQVSKIVIRFLPRVSNKEVAFE